MPISFVGGGGGGCELLTALHILFIQINNLSLLFLVSRKIN